MEIVLVWIICAVFTAVVASSKNRSGLGWFIVGLLFGPFALLAVGFMPADREGPVDHGSPGVATPETHVKCPDCAELVLNEARVCKHCHCKLVPVSEQPKVKTAGFTESP